MPSADRRRSPRKGTAMSTTPGYARSAGPVRSRSRARRLRRRLRRRHQGAKVARHREPGAHRAQEPPAPRSLRVRGQYRGWRGHHHPDAPRVPGPRVRPARHRASRPRPLWGRPGLPAARSRPGGHLPGHPRADRLRGGPDRARLARRAHRRLPDWAERPRGGTGHGAGRDRPGRGRARPRRLRAQALRDPEADRAHRPRQRPLGAEVLLRPEPLRQYPHLQGHAVRRPDRDHVPGRDGPARRVSTGPRPPALLDQYVPVLAARAPVSLHRPQRRDQHAARQYQLDAGARGALPLAPPRRRPQANPAHRGRGRQRLRRLRQRARVPRDGGSPPAPGRADDDSRGVERARVDGGGAAGLLRVPRLPHGALGRARVHRVHRRHRDRRRARPKRAAPLALLRHQGRDGRDGLRGGRPRHPGRARPAQGAPASRTHLPRRHRAGPHHRRRGAEAHVRDATSLRRVAEGVSQADREPARAALGPGARPRDGARAPARLRLHARGSAHPPRAHGGERRGARGLHGHRHVARRAVEPAATALRLLQAALRPGHQSAARRHPRGAGDADRDDDRARGQSPRADARRLPTAQAQDPDPAQRGAGADPPREPAGLQGRHGLHALPGRRRRGRPRARHGRALPPGEPGRRRRL